MREISRVVNVSWKFPMSAKVVVMPVLLNYYIALGGMDAVVLMHGLHFLALIVSIGGWLLHVSYSLL